jgi:hypothetical protein
MRLHVPSGRALKKASCASLPQVSKEGASQLDQDIWLLPLVSVSVQAFSQARNLLLLGHLFLQAMQVWL